IFAGTEDDVRVDGEGSRGQRRRGFGGLRIRVYPHAAEIVSELAPGRYSGGRVKGLAGRSEDLATTERGRPAVLVSDVRLMQLCEHPQGGFPLDPSSLSWFSNRVNEVAHRATNSSVVSSRSGSAKPSTHFCDAFVLYFWP